MACVGVLVWETIRTLNQQVSMVTSSNSYVPDGYKQRSYAFQIVQLKQCPKTCSASLAQPAARQSHNLKVVSSILTGSSFF